MVKVLQTSKIKNAEEPESGDVIEMREGDLGFSTLTEMVRLNNPSVEITEEERNELRSSVMVQ